jgi:hypothetical protein
MCIGFFMQPILRQEKLTKCTTTSTMQNQVSRSLKAPTLDQAWPGCGETLVVAVGTLVRTSLRPPYDPYFTNAYTQHFYSRPTYNIIS